MTAYVQDIQCVVPETAYRQSFIKGQMPRWTGGGERLRRCIEKLYDSSAIEKRHSVVADIDSFYVPLSDGSFETPSTHRRNDLYIEYGRRLFVEAGRKVLRANRGCGPVTHVITVSCTGFYNPGPGVDIIKALGLPVSVHRFHIGFMGCYGAFPALKLAQAICASDASATVLIVSVELCTLHAQSCTDIDTLLAGTIFADGAAAALVSGLEPEDKAGFALRDFYSYIIADSEELMTWRIAEQGFKMTLSRKLPQTIGRNVRGILEGAFGQWDISQEDIEHWAVHPGGKAILDQIEAALGIDDCLRDCRWVLGRFGNMSSATILFILERILRGRGSKAGENVLAMGFGPGVTVEAALMEKVCSAGIDPAAGGGYKKEVVTK